MRLPTLDERPALLRSLLEDRFHVVRRTEYRDLPIYAMVLAGSDRRLGPGLRRSAVDCDAVIAERDAGQRPVITPGTRPTCAAILGIKLEAQRGPSPVTIFERIEMPTED
jgi:uncharacterized protein (TIGR03435 family)